MICAHAYDVCICLKINPHSSKKRREEREEKKEKILVTHILLVCLLLLCFSFQSLTAFSFLSLLILCFLILLLLFLSFLLFFLTLHTCLPLLLPFLYPHPSSVGSSLSSASFPLLVYHLLRSSVCLLIHSLNFLLLLLPLLL